MDNITAYVPSSGGLQKIFLCATNAQVVATAQFSVAVPAYGKIKIVKNGENSEKLAGVKFGVFSDSACKNKITELVTGADGTITSGDLPAGTVYVKEISTISPYVLTSTAQTIAITVNQTATATFANVKATGKIRIEKVGDVLTSKESEETEYGTVSVPAYSQKGLAGVVYEVKTARVRLSPPLPPIHRELRKRTRFRSAVIQCRKRAHPQVTLWTILFIP